MKIVYIILYCYYVEIEYYDVLVFKKNYFEYVYLKVELWKLVNFYIDLCIFLWFLNIFIF